MTSSYSSPVVLDTDPFADPLAEEGGGSPGAVLQHPHVRPEQQADQPHALLVYPN